MKWVYVDNYIVRPTLDALTIKEIAKWFQDNPDIGITKLTYIYHMCDFNSQYEGYSDDIKHDKICEFIIRDKNFQVDDEIKWLITKYRETQEEESPTLSLYQNAKDVLYKFAEYYKGIDFDERDLKGQPVYKASEVAMSLGKVGAMMKAYDDMKERVKKEIFSTNKTKGDRAINKFER